MHDFFARHFFLLGFFALLLAGILALVLVLGRVPWLSFWVEDPNWIKVALVVHVNLALSVWFFSFFTALVVWDGRETFLRSLGLGLALGGVLLFVISGLGWGRVAILSNYIPMLEHPIFQGGLLLFFFGVFFAWLPYPRAECLPAASQAALQGGFLAAIFAAIAFFVTWWRLPLDLPSQSYYETLFWGTGHLLQFVHVFGMMAAWFLLLREAFQKEWMKYSLALLLFAIYLLFPLWSLSLLFSPPGSASYVAGFTALMRWGTWPIPSLVILFILVQMIKHKSRVSPDRLHLLYGLGMSIFLLLLGFLLGALISRSTTLIPAHYHASIGAVTLSYMAATTVLLKKEIQIRKISSKVLKLQPILFGLGQAIFALGFAYGGWHGLGRKVFGREQVLESFHQSLGLSVMGVGGFLAILGGLCYLYIVFQALQARKRAEKISLAGEVS